jgi:hypothetical protein
MALTGYIKLQYIITVYVNHRTYPMMALCGQNMSLNLHESTDSVVIQRLAYEAAYACKTAFCIK